MPSGRYVWALPQAWQHGNSERNLRHTWPQMRPESLRALHYAVLCPGGRSTSDIRITISQCGAALGGYGGPEAPETGPIVEGVVPAACMTPTPVSSTSEFAAGKRKCDS